jgi:hypothetical protein
LDINLLLSFLNSLSFDRLLWLVPVFFTLHNIEEVPFMENWSKRLPLKIHPRITTRQFVIAVTFLTLAGFLVTYIASESLHNRTDYLFVLGIQAILLFNAFVPHITSTIGFRMYSPGVVTAVILTLPFSWYLFHRALTETVLNLQQFWVLLGIAPFGTVIFALLSLRIGKVFDK